MDYKNAVESAPSELNAWNSYKYQNVATYDKDGNLLTPGTLFEGTEGVIKVEDTGSAVGDVIGFRVFAVNLDGTLYDPDGVAFYVAIGESQSYALITGVIDLQDGTESDFIETDAFANWGSNWNIGPANPAQTNPLYGGATPQPSSPTFSLRYFKEKNLSSEVGAPTNEVKYVKFVLDQAPSEYINGATYEQTYYPGYWNNAWFTTKTITCKMTKKMPTKFPSNFSFRPMQETSVGSGTFKSYMIPENGYPVATASTAGTKDLDNVFYNLDNDYKFVIKNSIKNSDGTYDDVVVTSATGYEFTVDNDPFIKNHVECSIDASYLYRSMSTYQKQDGTWVVGEDYPVKYASPISIIYACWHDAETYAWGTYNAQTDPTKPADWKSRQPVLKWTATGDSYSSDIAYINGKSSYNNDYFGGTLAKLVLTNGWLEITGTPELRYTDPTTGTKQVNPYFAPSINSTTGAITFDQGSIQVDSAPVADHVEQLVIKVKDAYGHVYEIVSDVTVKKPNTAN